MKKLAIVCSLTLFFSFLSATPPIEGDVLGSNEFVAGVDVSLGGLSRMDASAPFLYGGQNINGIYAPYSAYLKKDQDDSYVKQAISKVELNLRYGILNYIEIFGNANGYFQRSASADKNKDSDSTQKFDFANANVGILATLYKGDTFHILIGDNSDIVSNAVFNHSDSHLNYFKGHTFMFNLVKQEESSSYIAQVYYRLNLTQKYKDSSFKNGDEFGIRFLAQRGKEDRLMFFGWNLNSKDSDTINGKRLSNHHYESYGLGVTFGGKRDFNNHFGMKLSFDAMAYSLTSNTFSTMLNIGFYFK